MEPKKVGIIRGGKSEHYETSIEEGGKLISHLFSHLSDKWKPVDIFIDREGLWHASGIPVSPNALHERVDLFWDTTRRDAYLFLKTRNIANVSGGYSSFTGENRKMFGEHIKQMGINIPKHILIPAYQEDFDGQPAKFALKKATEILQKFSPPWRIRLLPMDTKETSRIVRTSPELLEMINEALNTRKSILVEEFIEGRNTLMHSVVGFMGKDIYIFPSLPGEEVSVYNNREEKEKLETFARNLHEYVPGAYYVNAGFILSKKGDIYLSDLEFSPDLNEGSHFCKSCEVTGINPHDVLLHILNEALK